MTFRVWQKVVCISQNPKWGEFPNVIFPQIDAVYTIRDIGPSYHSKCKGLAVRLLEIRNSDTDMGEPNFFAFRFRPLVERKTDISIFTRMLTPKKVGADA